MFNANVKEILFQTLLTEPQNWLPVIRSGWSHKHDRGDIYSKNKSEITLHPYSVSRFDTGTGKHSSVQWKESKTIQQAGMIANDWDLKIESKKEGWEIKFIQNKDDVQTVLTQTDEGISMESIPMISVIDGQPLNEWQAENDKQKIDAFCLSIKTLSGIGIASTPKTTAMNALWQIYQHISSPKA